ncbi:hypothetical protein [Pantoea sp. BAV 3049]|uniref:hypothetical protein n=1 Tax=Pantoea sp. BAV 3049 TaxID=2654188 RepID=UPI00131EB936|nr:hypothetical protein [Pantoea sp. BAV 3049]
MKKYHDNYGTIFNDYVTDYQATLQEMFSDKAVITFPLEWTAMVKDKDHTYNRPYSAMCLNGGWFRHVSNNDLSRSSARSWLVELTSDISVLDQFQDMQAYGNTQISSGLIRSVPVMMKGSNKRKVFILISDGEDNSGKNVTQNFLKQYHLCDKIKKGVAEKSGISNTRVEMYYISVTSAATRVKEWADNCVGEANAKTSTTREALIKEIKGIMADETGHFAS